MNSMKQEIEAFVTAETQPQAEVAGSDASGTWNHPALTEFAALCREDSDLLNFEALQLEGDKSDRNQPSRPASQSIQDLTCFESRLAGPSDGDGHQESGLSELCGARNSSLRTAAVRLPRAEAESWTSEDVLRWGFCRFSPHIAIASGFGAEGMVLVDMASRLRSNFQVFTLDTGFFFPETYELIEEVERRYGIKVERCRSELTPEQQGRVHGPALWARDPDRCCALRKVEPLANKLRQLTAWVSAIRREQTAARAGSFKIEWDARFELVKLNPLADWTSDDVWTYIRSHGVPYNPLHDRNYPSISCTHCTRAVRSGEHPRTGRWSGFEKTECGLHTRPNAAGGDSVTPAPAEVGENAAARNTSCN